MQWRKAKQQRKSPAQGWSFSAEAVRGKATQPLLVVSQERSRPPLLPSPPTSHLKRCLPHTSSLPLSLSQTFNPKSFPLQVLFALKVSSQEWLACAIFKSSRVSLQRSHSFQDVPYAPTSPYSCPTCFSSRPEFSSVVRASVLVILWRDDYGAKHLETLWYPWDCCIHQWLKSQPFNNLTGVAKVLAQHIPQLLLTVNTSLEIQIQSST